jgi:hypothetical protein
MTHIPFLFHQTLEQMRRVGEGITDEAVSAGWYVVGGGSGVRAGFVRKSNGGITRFSAPGAGSGSGQGTYVWSLSNAADMAGWYIDIHL